MLKVGLPLCLALALVACGGDDDGTGGTSSAQKFACDWGASTQQHYCYEWAWNGPANAADSFKGICTQNGATDVASCTATGKVGGCKYTTTSGSITVSWTGWYYFGTAAELMQACMSSGSVTATWVNP